MQGEVTSHQVVSTFIQRIKDVNPIINAMVDAKVDKMETKVVSEDDDDKEHKVKVSCTHH